MLEVYQTGVRPGFKFNCNYNNISVFLPTEEEIQILSVSELMDLWWIGWNIYFSTEWPSKISRRAHKQDIPMGRKIQMSMYSIIIRNS